MQFSDWQESISITYLTITDSKSTLGVESVGFTFFRFLQLEM